MISLVRDLDYFEKKKLSQDLERRDYAKLRMSSTIDRLKTERKEKVHFLNERRI